MSSKLAPLRPLVRRDSSTTQDGAYADVTVKVGLIKLLQKEVDLCEEAYVWVLV